MTVAKIVDGVTDGVTQGESGRQYARTESRPATAPDLPQEEPVDQDPSELFVPPGPQQLFQRAWATAQLECRDRILLEDIEARAECFTTIVLGLNQALRDNASTVLMGAPVKVRTRINPLHKSVLNLVSSYFLGFGYNVAWRPSGRPDGLITEVSGGQGRTTLLMDLYVFPVRCQQMKIDPEVVPPATGQDHTSLL